MRARLGSAFSKPSRIPCRSRQRVADRARRDAAASGGRRRPGARWRARGGAFGILHGAGNGLLTIVKGTLPLALFGPHGYGERQGLLMVPARIAQAAAPLLFGFVLDRWGTRAMWLSGALSLAAFGVLFCLPRTPREPRSAMGDVDVLASTHR